MKSVYRYSVLAMLVLVGSSAARAEDLKVLQLQQDVLDLQRSLQQQSRKIEALENELKQLRMSATTKPMRENLARLRSQHTDPSNAWLNIENWDRVHTGTTELDVIAALGPPTAVRKAPDARETLLYSLEIAAGGFLSGQVVLDDHRVSDVQKPVLK